MIKRFNTRFSASRRVCRLRTVLLSVVAATGLAGCLQYVQPEPDVMIVQGPPAGAVHMHIPYHVGAGVPINGFLGGYPLHHFGFWYNPFSPDPWGLSPYAGAFTSLYYPWYGWSPIGWRPRDPVYACAAGRRLWCRPGWLVPGEHGPALADDPPNEPERSPLVPYRPTYGGLAPTAQISQVDLWQIWQRDRFGPERYAGERSPTGGYAGNRQASYVHPNHSAASQAAAGGVRSAGVGKGGPSRTQPISRSVRPDAVRTSRQPAASSRPLTPRSGSSRSVRSVDRLSPRSHPGGGGRNGPSQSQR